uniref:Peptidase A2 domain-containing protein n=1 Tax=Strongyloides papillosus TaxID=174720 RepID=A0A0N5BET6_STREA
MEVPPANIKFYLFLRPLTIITRELQRYCYIVLAVVSYGYISTFQSLQTFDMKTIFRRKKRNDADLLSFETAVENLKPKWRKNQEDALDKSAEDQQEVYRQMKQEFDELRRRHGITAEIQPPIFQFKIKDTTELQNKINQDLMKNIRADGLLVPFNVPFNGTTVHDLEKWITQTLTMLKTIALTEERIPLTMKIAKNYLNKLIPDGNRFDNIMKRAWTDKNDDIEQIFKKMIHILHSTGIAENEKCKLSTPIQGQDESVMNYSKRFEEYHKQLEGTDEFNRLIHADTISTRLNFVKDDALPMQIYRIPNNCILTDPSVYVKINSIYINDKDSSELQLHNTEALCDTTKVFEDLNGNKYDVVPIATNSYKVSAVKRASHYLEYFSNFESVEKCPEIIEISDHPSVKIEPILPSQPPAASINQTVLRKRPPIDHKDDEIDEKSQLKEVLSKLELEKEQWLRDKALLERTIQDKNAKHESLRFDLQSQIDQKDKDIKTLNSRITDYQSSISEKSQQLRNFQQQLQSLSSSVKANDPKDLMKKVTNLENYMNNFKCPTIPALSCPPCDPKNVNANINNLKQRTPTDLDKRISGIEYSMTKLEHAINSYSPSIDVRPEINGLHAAISEIPTLMKQLKEEQVENKHSNSTTSVTCHCANSPDLTEWLTNIPKKGIEETMTGMPSSIVAIISIILTLLTKNGLHHLRNRFNSHPSTTREEAQLYIVDDSPKYRSIQVRTDEEMEINEILQEASPIITLDVGTTRLDTLIDTGANLNVIHWNSFQQMSDKYKSEIRTTTQRARAANGQAMKFEGEVDVYLTIGNRHVAVPTLISKEINHDFIIGRQTLKEMGDSTLFNWKRGRIEFGDQFYDIKNSSKVYSKKKITLPPYSSNIIHCGLQAKDFPYENGYFIVNDDFRKDNLLLTCNQLGNIHENMYAVLIINMGNNPVTLPKNKQIGRIAGIVAETDNSVTIKGEELIPDGGDWEENLPPYPVNKILSDNELLSLINWKECNLSKRNIEKLKKIVLKYNLAFHEYDGKIGRYKGKEKLTIRLKDNNSLPKPIRAQQLSREKEAEIERQIKQMIEEDMIEPSRSPYLSRVVLVKKKDSNWRFVVDFRRINSLVEAQSHHIPKIQNILNEAAGKRFYSTFDLKSGFHQIALDASSRKLASFVTHQVQMPFKELWKLFFSDL